MNTTDNPLVRVVTDTRYVLLGLPPALVSFTVVLTGLAAGAGSAVVVLGLFLLVGALYTARGFAHAESPPRRSFPMEFPPRGCLGVGDSPAPWRSLR
ncbi:sensor domain-containing protein [Actinorugispora endophytica]|uniref:Putative sensor protein n=1 Tax=Actinorugispora endophytica TaxID=1605990 RepID=A0A4R6V2T3_9ACTN|nr:sensor domain-containing protein [Actinorugispora endophytica]TDQ54350.1 putative sensor protein [Actinorugispora endophytica]